MRSVSMAIPSKGRGVAGWVPKRVECVYDCEWEVPWSSLL